MSFLVLTCFIIVLGVSAYQVRSSDLELSFADGAAHTLYVLILLVEFLSCQVGCRTIGVIYLN